MCVPLAGREAGQAREALQTGRLCHSPAGADPNRRMRADRCGHRLGAGLAARVETDGSCWAVWHKAPIHKCWRVPLPEMQPRIESPSAREETTAGLSSACPAVRTETGSDPLQGSAVCRPQSALQPVDPRTVLRSLNRPPSPRNSDQASSLSLAGTLVPHPEPTLELEPHALHQASPQASALLRQRHLVGPQDQTYSPGPNLQCFGVMAPQVEDASR